MEIKEGDLYSYATLNVQSHGYTVKTNEEFYYEVELNNFPDVHMTLRVHAGNYNPDNISIKPENIDRLIWDPRSYDGCSLVMVYRSGKTKEQVMNMIKPQLLNHMDIRYKGYLTLVNNAGLMREMIDRDFVDHFICPRIEQ